MSPDVHARIGDLLPLAQAWSRRDAHNATRDELARLVRVVEPVIEDVNDLLDNQEGRPETWPEEMRALRNLADVFNEAAFDDEIWRLAFPTASPG